MRTSLRKMGNSSGLIIPKPLLAEIGAKTGDAVEVVAEADRIVILPVRSTARAGWAEDAKRLAEAKDDGAVWPDFPNESDADLTW